MAKLKYCLCLSIKKLFYKFISLPASGEFCLLLMIFAISLDPDQIIPDILLGLIWIQAVRHSGFFPEAERIF